MGSQWQRYSSLVATLVLLASCGSPGGNRTGCAVQNGGCSDHASCSDTDAGVSCTCESGYEGDGRTCVAMSACGADPCQNDGICAESAGGYTCTCPQGVSGERCEIVPGHCEPNPCQHGATCTETPAGRTCSCTPGYTGAECETDIDDCSPNPCLHGGTCTDGVASYTCSCAPGYTGAVCATDVDDCSPNPCQHGGTCTDGVATHTCTCVPGYTGADCATDVDDCSPNPCQHGGTCTDGVATHTCSCVPGYIGADCGTNIDECNPDPCLNGGTCIDGVASYTCSCVPGYGGARCETDIDECNPNPCLHGGTCTDGLATHTCSCPSTWRGDDCEVDVDECAEDRDGCDTLNGVCTNNDGGFACSCVNPATLEADGHTCAVVCSAICDPNAHCLANGTDAVCVCDPGHEDLSSGLGLLCDGPPVVSCSPPPATEDTAFVLTLQYYDLADDPSQLVIDSLDQPLDVPRAGKLYQYGSVVPITTYPAVVSDALGRVIYVPAPNCNSQGLPAALEVMPRLVFHAAEVGYTDGDPDHTSAPLTVPIYIQAANDPPSTSGTWSGAGLCWSACAYEEDFGFAPYVIYPPALVYAGGSDVEGSTLSVTITDLVCPVGSVVTFAGESVAVGTTVFDNPAGQLSAVFLFKPLPDENGSPYCTVTYRVNDGELDSLDTRTITIDVTPVNDWPRLAQQELTTFEDVPLAFNLDVADIDSPTVSVTIESCTIGDVGELWAQTPGGDVRVDCDTPPFALTPSTSPASWPFIYVPPTGKSGLQMMVVELALDDERGEPPPEETHAWVILNVLAVNNPPLLASAPSGTEPTWTQDLVLAPTATAGQEIDFDLRCQDVDAGANPVVWSMTADHGDILFEPSAAVQEQLQNLETWPGHLSFKLPISLMQQALDVVRFKSTHVGANHLTCTLNDQGFVGQCAPLPDGTPGARYCPLEATADVTVTITP